MRSCRTTRQAPVCPEGRYENLLAIMEVAHTVVLRLCDLLEGVADSLPGAIDRATCRMLALELEPILRGLHRFEEETLFPACQQITGTLPKSLDRLRAEHVEDESFAGEIAEALLALSRTGSADNPEALGFMLRGFFESQRRHIAFEREHLLPALCGTRH